MKSTRLLPCIAMAISERSVAHVQQEQLSAVFSSQINDRDVSKMYNADTDCILRPSAKHCQQCNTFHGHVRFTYMNGPQVYKLFTLALGAAKELHRCSRRSSTTTGKQSIACIHAKVR